MPHSPTGDNMLMEKPPVVIDIGAVAGIAAELLAVGDELAAQTRPLRLPIMNPASDPFTVRICTYINHERVSLGAVGSDAGEELARMAEFLLATAFNLHHIGRWTTLAIRGIGAAPLARRSLDITPRPHRADLVDHEPRPEWLPSTDSEVLACAAALSAGDPEISELYYPDPRTLRALGERVRACSAQMAVAWPNAESAAAKYRDFAQWISTSLISACERSAAAAKTWVTLYAQVRASLAAPAERIVSAQAALLDGSALGEALEPRGVDNGAFTAEAIWQLLDPYVNFGVATDPCEDYPRLKV